MKERGGPVAQWQCSIERYRIPIEGGNVHCWNEKEKRFSASSLEP